jgi:hypothetical protein
VAEEEAAMAPSDETEGSGLAQNKEMKIIKRSSLMRLRAGTNSQK